MVNLLKLYKKQIYFFIIGLIFSLGVILRIKTYILGRPLWHDECSLGLSILKMNIYQYFSPLMASQIAPPLFMIFTKIITSTFGVNSLTIRFIPFISGILSIFVFYKLSTKILDRKFSIIAANFLFAINYQLIYYTQEFKQYSTDVLIFMICLLFFNTIDFNQFNIKKYLIFSLLILLIFFTSLPSAFVILAFISYLLINKTNIKKLFLCFIPVFIIGAILYKLHNNELGYYVNFWQNGFLTFNLSNILLNIKDNFNFFFNPNLFVLLELILFIYGLILSLKRKTKINYIILFSLIFVIFASVLRFYPILERVSLFLLPIFILFISKTLDAISLNKRFKTIIILILFSLSFYKYSPFFINSYFSNNCFSRGEQPQVAMEYLVQNIKPNDIIFVNNASISEFTYYSSFYNLKNKFIEEKFSGQSNSGYLNTLNWLPEETYWFYLPFDYSHSKVVPIISFWAQDKVLINRKFENSILIKVKINK